MNPLCTDALSDVIFESVLCTVCRTVFPLANDGARSYVAFRLHTFTFVRPTSKRRIRAYATRTENFVDVAELISLPVPIVCVLTQILPLV